MARTHALVQSSTQGLGGTAGVEGQRDGKLHAGKSLCVCDRVTVGTCKMCFFRCVKLKNRGDMASYKADTQMECD